MAANTTNFSVRLDCDIKKQFEVRMDAPKKETVAAMLEAERIAKDPSVKHYSDVEDALRALKK